MKTFIIMAAIAATVYWLYTIAMFWMFGVPESYSNTFYLLNEKKKGLGVLFPIILILTVAMVMPGWFVVSDTINVNLDPLCFFGGGGLLFVAVAPFFKEMTIDTGNALKDLIYRSFHGQGLVHTIGALLAMICTTVWCALTPLWYILVAILVITILAMICTKSWKAITFWVEFFVFNTIFATVIIYYCIL